MKQGKKPGFPRKYLILSIISLIPVAVFSFGWVFANLCAKLINQAFGPSSTKTTPYAPGMNWAVIALFVIVPMIAWALTLWAMKGYEPDGKRVKTINAVNTARRTAIANGMSMEEAIAAITDETVG